jgi:ABC-type sugar transport system ATPase subunit
LEELRSIGDYVTILRDGATVHSAPLKEVSRDQLIQHMVGRAVNSIYRREPVPPGEVLLKVKGLSRGFLRDISFDLRAGEIVGLGGLMGAGRTELCRVLFGLDPAEHGSVEIAGKPVTPRNPRQAVASGVALIPEDRQNHGLALKLSISHNITMPDLGRVSSFGILNKSAEASLAEDYRQRLRIKCSTPRQLAGRLSGGNQQKIVIAKWASRGARIFLFDEPTRGIDIGAKQEVFEEMDRLARSGAAVLMVSSELPELCQVADRILVMAQGRLTGELPRHATQEQIMHLAAPTEAAPMEAL